MSAEDHGPTCAESPIDHKCGVSEGDQGVSWEQALSNMSERCRLIASYHKKSEGPGGMTDGYCTECEQIWPCRTFHLAAGWGLGDECFDQKWCTHAGVRVE